MYLFTDGSSLKNGKKNCTARYGYILAKKYGDLNEIYYGDDNVPNVSLKLENGEIYETNIITAPTNNRAELLGMIFGLISASSKTDDILNIYSDSQYVIKSITIWIPNWIKTNQYENRPNHDLFVILMHFLNICKEKYKTVKFHHVYSHTKRSSASDDFIWRGNDMVDKLCTTGKLMPTIN
jgi:ribonuclease HI